MARNIIQLNVHCKGLRCLKKDADAEGVLAQNLSETDGSDFTTIVDDFFETFVEQSSDCNDNKNSG